MKGRRPVPASLKLLRGNPGKRPLRPEPSTTPLDAHTPPPRWLSAQAKAEWRRLVALLTHAGVASTLDGDAIAMLAVALTQWKAATAHLAKHGLTASTPSGRTLPSPYVRIAHQASTTVRHMLVELGATPISRPRVSHVSPPSAPDDPLGKFLRRRGPNDSAA